MKMLLPEKKTFLGPSLSRESRRAATTNMFFGAMLWSGIMTTISIITGEISSATDFAFLPVGFLIQAAFGFIVALIPMLIGTKLLAVWLQRNYVSHESATISGAVIGALVISMLTVPVSIVGLMGRVHGAGPSFISLLAVFNLPIAVSAALAGGRTGLQMAKLMETQNQDPVESAQNMPASVEPK